MSSPSILIVRRWCSEPVSEASGSLGFAPNVFSCYSIPSILVILLVPILLLIHILHFRHPFQHPYLLLFHAILLPPPPGHLHSRALIRFQTEIQNEYGHDKLCDYVLEVGDVRLQLLEYHFRHFHCQWWVDPTSVHLLSLLPPYQFVYHLVVKSAHSRTNAWRHHQNLWY